MSKNKLLIAISAGLFAATPTTGAFAQTSSGAGNDTTAMDSATASPAPSASGAKHHKMRKHNSAKEGTKKTPAASTGNDSATESGQSK